MQLVNDLHHGGGPLFAQFHLPSEILYQLLLRISLQLECFDFITKSVYFPRSVLFG